MIAGRTGIGLSQRMQSFVLDPAENPYNVVEPGKQPRVTSQAPPRLRTTFTALDRAIDAFIAEAQLAAA